MEFNIHLHLSDIYYSPISLGESISSILQSNPSLTLEYLLQALEINRALIAAMNKDWASESEMYSTVQALVNKQKELEYQVSQLLNP
ncbi:hypothetical protein [uncultured Algoriphagus sp.]|uniref:hypothetical protein n=1 Tax=uncultured Algoriphagus sp. TaxID=417365 RepID=UPI0030EF0978|tara:strand:- start:128699 stop:128959 length:261 start_codon:yes stop_codon:yes gene_type:complete